jgi:two-component system sensor histidine kinase and response regulator WspE
VGRGSVLQVVVVNEKLSSYGFVVDRFLGERDLVVQPLDVRLGKVNDISAAALMIDGAPVLILDVDDLLRSIEKQLSESQLKRVSEQDLQTARQTNRRVLVVDDSLTVRETERKLLENSGYEVDVAVNGVDGWNAVHGSSYDLVITDIDMPRMNGFELTRLIKQDTVLKETPVIILSYKEREEDRVKGLEAGANYYLTKSSFQNDTFINAVQDLIGKAHA